MRVAFGAGLALFVALGCCACGSAHAVRSTTTTKTAHAAPAPPIDVPPDTNFVILRPIHGAGDETLGTFTVAGRGAIEVQCTGKSPMRVAGLWTVPCEGNASTGELGFDTAGQRIHLVVRAKPGTTWWLAVGEHIPVLRKSAPPMVVLLHRTGVGNKSFGPLELRGKFHVEDSCSGTGQLNVYV